MKKHFAKCLHLGIGVHSFGNATTMNAKEGELSLQLVAQGIIATSYRHNKKALIPYANIKAIELPFDSDFMNEEEVVPNAVQIKVAELNKRKAVQGNVA